MPHPFRNSHAFGHVDKPVPFNGEFSNLFVREPRKRVQLASRPSVQPWKGQGSVRRMRAVIEYDAAPVLAVVIGLDLSIHLGLLTRFLFVFDNHYRVLWISEGEEVPDIFPAEDIAIAEERPAFFHERDTESANRELRRHGCPTDWTPQLPVPVLNWTIQQAP